LNAAARFCVTARPITHPPIRMTSFSRRDFLKYSTLAGLAASSWTKGFSASPAPALTASATEAKKNPIMLFSKHVQWLELEEVGPFLRECGFDGVDLAVRQGGHVPPDKAEQLLPKAVELLTKAGLSVPMMVTDIKDAEHPLSEPVLRAAAGCGIKIYRLAYHRYEDALGIIGTLDTLRPKMAKLAELNAKCGIHGAWQNHDGVRPGASMWDIWYTLKDLDPRWLGVQFDPRHAVAEGGNSWVNDFALVKDRVRSTVAKDFLWAKGDNGRWGARHVPMGEGMVDFARYFELYRQFKLEGPISLHVEFPLFQGDETTMSKSEKLAAASAVFTRELKQLRGYMEKAGIPA
jgi:sugar phosphate isomerase/epimerase